MAPAAAPGTGMLALIDLDPRMAALLTWWTVLPRTGDLPGVAEIDPLALKRWLGDLGVIEAIGEPPRFRIRLAGVNLRDIETIDATGCFVDELCPPQIADEVLKPYRVCREQRRPVHDRLALHERPHVTIERLLLPFGRRAERMIAHILRVPDATSPALYPVPSNHQAALVCTVL